MIILKFKNKWVALAVLQPLNLTLERLGQRKASFKVVWPFGTLKVWGAEIPLDKCLSTMASHTRKKTRACLIGKHKKRVVMEVNLAVVFHKYYLTITASSSDLLSLVLSCATLVLDMVIMILETSDVVDMLILLLILSVIRLKRWQVSCLLLKLISR